MGGEVDQVDTWSERADHARLLRGPDVLWHAQDMEIADVNVYNRITQRE